MRKPESKFSLFALEYAQYMYINVFTFVDRCLGQIKGQNACHLSICQTIFKENCTSSVIL